MNLLDEDPVVTPALEQMVLEQKKLLLAIAAEKARLAVLRRKGLTEEDVKVLIANQGFGHVESIDMTAGVIIVSAMHGCFCEKNLRIKLLRNRSFAILLKSQFGFKIICERENCNCGAIAVTGVMEAKKSELSGGSRHIGTALWFRFHLDNPDVKMEKFPEDARLFEND